MLLNEVKEKLKDRNIKAVAKSIDVHYNTLYKLLNGVNEPSYSTLSKLIAYLSV